MAKSINFAGGANITLSTATAVDATTITISGGAGAAAATAISGISASDTVYTSGTVAFTGSQAVTVRSGAGQKVVIDAPAQTVQTQNAVDLTLSGNTSGALALVSSGTLTLAGGNNITLSQAGNAVTISGANVGGAQTAISGLQNSETTYTSGTVKLSELGAITIRSTTGQAFQFSVNSQSVQAETQTFVGGIRNSETTYTSGTVNLSVVGGPLTIRSTTGNAFQFSASQSVQAETQTFLGALKNTETTYTSGTVELEGTNNITVFSTTGQRFRISGANTHAQQTAISGISNSETTYTSGTVGLSVVGGALTIRSTTGNAFQFSASQSVQAETQTFIGGISNSETNYTSGTVKLSELANITIRSTTGNAFQFSVAAPSGETQTAISGIANTETTYTSGTVQLSAANTNLTIASAAGQKFVFSIDRPFGGLGVSTGGNTAGTTGTVADPQFSYLFVGSNNITLSQSRDGASKSGTVTILGANTHAQQTGVSALYDGANSISSGTVRLTDANGVTFSLNAQTLSASVNQSISMFAVSNTTQSSSGTAHKSALSFGGAGIASVGVTGGSVVVSVPSGGGAAYSAGMSTNGNTSGDTGFATQRLMLAGGNNVTLSGSTNGGSMSITVSVPNTASQSVQTQGIILGGVSTGGNTEGNTTVNSGTRMVFVGSNMVTLSQATAANATTVTIKATQSVQTQGVIAAGVSTGGSTAGNTQVSSGTRLVFVGTDGILLSQATAADATTITFAGPGAQMTYSGWDPFGPNYPLLTMVAAGQGTVLVEPINAPNLQHDHAAIPVFYSNASNSSFSNTLSVWVGLYTRNASTLSLLQSTSRSSGITNSGTVGNYSLVAGLRHFSIPWTQTVSASNYWVAIASRTTTGGGAGQTWQQVFQQTMFAASQHSGFVGRSTANSMYWRLGLGRYSATSAGVPNSMAFSDITGNSVVAGTGIPMFYFGSVTV